MRSPRALLLAAPRRIVVCSSLGAADSAAHIAWFPAWLLKHPLADKTALEAVLAAGRVSHLVVRPPRLLDAPARGLAAVAEVPSNASPPTKQISRADVAAFMLAHLEGKDGTVNIAWSAA